MKILLAFLPALFLMTILVSCAPAPAGTVTVRETVTTTTTQTATGDLTQMQAQYDELKAQLASSNASDREQIAGLLEQLETLQANYDTLQQNAGSTDLHDPTWEEVRAFVQSDNIDATVYDINTFTCTGYALILRDRARTLGMRTAFIALAMSGTTGHALNAFQTGDKGLVYIDCTGSDKVGYVQKGKTYGTIGIDYVKEKYIACDMLPDAFWQPLTYVTDADPFDYEYYTGYMQRRDFYTQTVTAYNDAVVAFNRGTGSLKRSQMETWQSNILELEKDIGNIYYEPLGTVANIETYWGD